MKNNHDTSGLDARNILLDKPKYWAAHIIALLDGWKAYITARDEIKGDKMSDANIADIPLPVATQSGAPSMAARRFSNIEIVGFAKRP